jgi:hypothetical protein
MNNGETPEAPVALDFSNSVAHNILWIKQMADQHDCSQGMVASAALMTMTMMDHHRLSIQVTKLEQEIAAIAAAVCPSSL